MLHVTRLLSDETATFGLQNNWHTVHCKMLCNWDKHLNSVQHTLFERESGYRITLMMIKTHLRE